MGWWGSRGTFWLVSGYGEEERVWGRWESSFITLSSSYPKYIQHRKILPLFSPNFPQFPSLHSLPILSHSPIHHLLKFYPLISRPLPLMSLSWSPHTSHTPNKPLIIFFFILHLINSAPTESLFCRHSCFMGHYSFVLHFPRFSCSLAHKICSGQYDFVVFWFIRKLYFAFYSCMEFLVNFCSILYSSSSYYFHLLLSACYKFLI